MSLHERVQAENAGELAQVANLRVGEIAQDQQHGVGARPGELANLLLLGEEALPEQGRSRCRSGRAQVGERAAEALVHEHRDRRRADVREGACQPRRVGVDA